MRYLTFILLLFSGALIGQTTQDSLLQQLRSVVVVNSSVNVDTNEYNIVVTQFQDPTSLYNVMDIEAGDWLWTLSSVAGQACNRYEIVSIANTGIGEYTINALNPDRTGVNGMPQAGVGNPVFKHSPNQDYPLFISSQPTLSGYINPNIQSCVTTHLILAIDKDINAIGDSVVVSILTDNSDGTYTHDDGNGNTVIVDTRADSNPVTDSGDFYAGDNVEDILQEIPNLGCSTISQTSHGLTVGQMATFTDQYGLAMTDTSIHLPIGMVTEVFNVNSFRMCYEGKIRGAHGLTADRDYFLQDDGSFDTIPDPDVPVFAFRTIGVNERIFDVPEYISNGENGGGGDNWGSQVVVSDETLTGDGTTGNPLSVDLSITATGDSIAASNGLNVDRYAAGGRIVSDVRLGGTLDENTIIRGDTGVYDFLVLDTDDITMEAEDTGVFYGRDFSQIGMTDPINGTETTVLGDSIYILAENGFLTIRNPDSLNMAATKFKLGTANFGRIHSTFGGAGGLTTIPLAEIYWDDDQVILRNYNSSGTLLNSFTVHKDYFQITGAPNYANDAAADADGTLPSGGIYTVTAEDRTLRIKP